MASKALPHRDILLQLLRYEPTTGNLYWRNRHIDSFEGGGPARAQSWNTKHAGRPAIICLNAKGYKTGRILKVACLSHRVIWKMVYGSEPDQIDHINGDKCDNRLSNLREVDNATNHKNMPLQRNNTSGVVGVSRHWRGWQAVINKNGKRVGIGVYVRFDDAVKARKRAERELGYHENHGRI